MLNYHRNKLDEALRSDLLYLYQNNEDAPFLYAYDNNRNITHIQQDTAHIYYQYDALNQLTREDNSVLNKSIVYSYDDHGNLLTRQEYAYVADGGALGEPTATITYGYEAENQTWADQLTSYNGEAFNTQYSIEKCVKNFSLDSASISAREVSAFAAFSSNSPLINEPGLACLQAHRRNGSICSSPCSFIVDPFVGADAVRVPAIPGGTAFAAAPALARREGA